MTRDLVERARKGDHDAFAELAGAAISRLDATAWLMLRDADRATDAVQNALVRAWRDLPTLRDPDRFDAWLRRLLVNACIDEIRRVRRRHLDVDITDLSNPPSIADAASAIADRDQLERPSAGSSPRSGRSSSCITTSTCRCRRSRRRSGSRWARPSPACTAGSGRCGRRSTPTLAPGPTSERGARHEPQRRLRPPRLRLAPRGCRAPGAGAPRCGPAADPDGAPATGMVEPRKVAPRGYRHLRLHAGCPAMRLAAGRPRPARRARRRWQRCRSGRASALPHPFGPARNGAIVTEPGRRHLCRSIRSRMPNAVIIGADLRLRPGLLPGRDEVHVPARRPAIAADRQGPHPGGRERRRERRPRADPQLGLDWVDWSPDSRQIAFLSRKTAKGTGPDRRRQRRWQRVDGRSTSAGRPISCRGCRRSVERSCSAANRTPRLSHPPGIWAVHPDGTGLHELTDQPGDGSTRLHDAGRRAGRPNAELYVASVPDGSRSTSSTCGRASTRSSRAPSGTRSKWLGVLLARTDAWSRTCGATRTDLSSSWSRRSTVSGTGIARRPAARPEPRRSTSTGLHAGRHRPSSSTTATTARSTSLPIDGSPRLVARPRRRFRSPTSSDSRPDRRATQNSRRPARRRASRPPPLRVASLQSGHDPPSHPDPRRRHRAGAGGGDHSRPRRDRDRLRMGDGRGR